MESNDHNAPQQDTGENPSARAQHPPLQAGYAQPATPPGEPPEPNPSTASHAPGQAPSMGPYGPYQAPAAHGPGQAPGMGMYGPGYASAMPPSGPGQATGAGPQMQAAGGYQGWPYQMAGQPPPPSPWTQAPYYGPAGPQGYGPYAGPAPGEREAGIDGLVQDVMNGNVGLSSLTKLLGLGDKEFWKGALIGSAIVMLLTNDSIKQALFGSRRQTSETSPPSAEEG